jgi:hypothetical protein
MAMPNVFELITTIKDMHTHHDGGGACRECGQAHPCRTYAYVDGLLAARFDETGPDFPTACTQMHEHDPIGCAPEIG